MPTTENFAWVMPTVAGDNNAWGQKLNDMFEVMDADLQTVKTDLATLDASALPKDGSVPMTGELDAAGGIDLTGGKHITNLTFLTAVVPASPENVGDHFVVDYSDYLLHHVRTANANAKIIDVENATPSDGKGGVSFILFETTLGVGGLTIKAWAAATDGSLLDSLVVGALSAGVYAFLVIATNPADESPITTIVRLS